MQKGFLKQHSHLLTNLLRATDASVCFFSGFLAFRMTQNHWDIPPKEIYILFFLTSLVFFVFPLFSLYQGYRGIRIEYEMRKVFLAWASVFFLLSAFILLAEPNANYSRSWLLVWSGLGGITLFFSRFILRRVLYWFRSKGYNYREIVIIGAGELGQKIVDHLREGTWAGISVIGFFDDNEELQEKSIQGIPILGTVNQAKNYMENHRVDQVWITLPLRAEKRMKEVLHQLRHHTAEICFVPDIFGFQLLNHSITEIANIPIVNLSSSPMVGTNRVIKEIEDRLLALTILVLISPVMILIAIGIKITSKGPILFKQKRHGWNGKPVQIWKFRSMYIHTEKSGMITQAQKKDSRITPFGYFLRRTSLDELPQFINVLQGRMSIVGPRPHAIEHNEIYKDVVQQYMRRHIVKPGITGWAQVNGWRGATDTLEKMEKRIEHDLYYIENWSVFFDIKIILMTLFIGFIHKNAY